MNVRRFRILGKNTLCFGMNILGLRGYNKIKDNIWAKEFGAGLSFDIDYKEDEFMLKGIVKLLNRFRIQGSFACIGKYIEQRTERYRILKGHEIINHSYSHPYHKITNPRQWHSLNSSEIEKEVTKGHEIIKNKLGYKCSGFRTPHFDITNEKNTISTLIKTGYRYDSSGYDPRYCPQGSLPFKKNGFIEVPCYRKISSYYCLRYKKYGLTKWKKLLFDAVIKEKNYHGFACFYFDPMDFRNKLDILEELISFIQKNGGIFCTFGQTALNFT